MTDIDLERIAIDNSLHSTIERLGSLAKKQQQRIEELTRENRGYYNDVKRLELAAENHYKMLDEQLRRNLQLEAQLTAPLPEDVEWEIKQLTDDCTRANRPDKYRTADLIKRLAETLQHERLERTLPQSTAETAPHLEWLRKRGQDDTADLIEGLEGALAFANRELDKRKQAYDELFDACSNFIERTKYD